MKSPCLPFARGAMFSTHRLGLIVALLGLVAAPLIHAGPNKVELPLILDEERVRLPRVGAATSERINYDHVVIFGRLEFPELPGDYEPVGLHLDPSLSIRPEKPKRRDVQKGRSKTSGPDDQTPLHWMAQSLAFFANKYVLMSARLEKRWGHEFRVKGSAGENVEDLEELFEKEGVELRLIGGDAYVLLEAPGKEKPFPYTSRPRAVRYESEREAWLVAYPGYVAQGLIYQPTGVAPDYPERDVRVRHAAAALAKLTGKEVFVQPLVEKRKFKAPKATDDAETPEEKIAWITKELEDSNTRILELNPRSLALVAE